MTIRTRNRFTLIFFIFSSLVFAVELFLLIFQICNKTFEFPQVQLFTSRNSFLLKYNPYIVVTAIITMGLYVCTTTYFISRTFEKTQSSEILFFLLFLFAGLVNTSRIFIPIFHLSHNYSRLLMETGNAVLFSTLLAPLSLFAVVALSSDEYRQNIERYSLIILIAALFFSRIIPLNTARILPDFSIEFSSGKLIGIFIFIINILNIVITFIFNKKNEFDQWTCLAFALIELGYGMLCNAYSIINYILAVIFLAFGTPLYLIKLHRHYMWID